jgi:hypothetical protein
MKGQITIITSDSLIVRLFEKSELNEVSASELSRTILDDYFTNVCSKHQQADLENSLKEVESLKYRR